MSEPAPSARPVASPRLTADASAQVLIALIVVVAVVPLLAGFGAKGYILGLLTRVMIFAIAAVSLDLILGYGNLVSFGHAAFLGIGSYAVGILSAHGIDNLLLHVVVALVAAGGFAAATSFVSLRTTGVYYIMSTLAFGQMLYFFGVSLSSYGGDDGMTLDHRSRIAGLGVLDSDTSLYYVALVVLAASVFAGRRLIASRFGRVLTGTRENALRMRAIGYEPFRYQITACVIAGMVCAVAGVLLANQTSFVSPAYMTWQRSGDLLIMVLLGGSGTLIGPVLGAFALLLLEEILAGITEEWKLIFGPLLVISVLIGRGGLWGLISRLRGRAGSGDG